MCLRESYCERPSSTIQYDFYKPPPPPKYREVYRDHFIHLSVCVSESPQWGAVDAEIKVPSGENTA